jgi:hypothetical protein
MNALKESGDQRFEIPKLLILKNAAYFLSQDKHHLLAPVRFEGGDLERLLRYRRNNKLEFLSQIKSIVEMMDIPYEKIMLFEFGANQFSLHAGWDSPYNSSIADFFAVSGDKNYCAFDTMPKSSLQCAKRNHKKSIDDFSFQYKGLDLNELCKQIRAISARDYKEMLSKIEKSKKRGKVPIIFSDNTLNSPYLDKSCNFWKIPALQVQRVFFDEIIIKIGIGDNEYPNTQVYPYSEKFKEYFEIQRDLNIYTHNTNVTNLWNNL